MYRKCLSLNKHGLSIMIVRVHVKYNVCDDGSTSQLSSQNAPIFTLNQVYYIACQKVTG